MNLVDNIKQFGFQSAKFVSTQTRANILVKKLTRYHY